jgi:phosphoglycerol transferase MdoB-like AlkP superfamily enzyme
LIRPRPTGTTATTFTGDGSWRDGLVRFRPVAVLALCYLAFGGVLRVVLWISFGRQQGVPLEHLPIMLLGGSLNDLVESLYLMAPLFLYLLAMRDRWYRTRWNRLLVATGTFLTLFGLVYLSVAEFFFFEEFDARFNVVAVDYLMFPAEVLGDLRAEYPVGAVACAAALAAALLMPLSMRLMRPGFVAPVRLRQRTAVFAAYLASLLAAVAWYPTTALSWTANRVENELVQNGASSFFRALAKSEIAYDAYYPTAAPADNLALLAAQLDSGRSKFVDLDAGRIDRVHPGRTDGLGRLNVVVVASESFGAEFSRLYGSELDLTPNFDRLAQQGIWFRHAYATGTRTVRGLEAISASFPPIPTVSILRRPGSEHISTWGSVMRELGYSTSFLYGGYGYFDNMNHYFGENGFEVLDRRDIPQPVRFENIWGVADEDLFDMALGHLDGKAATGQPFFALIMTTSNHKPFTFREGVPGVPPQGGGRKAGVRYADYALGYFIDEARRHDWFDDTVFVVLADHGARVYGKADMPLRSYEIPWMIYSPRHVGPRRVDQLVSQIDVAPTVMGLLGLPYRAPFFGEDALAGREEGRVALFSYNHDVAIYRDGKLVRFGLQEEPATLAYDRQSDSYAPRPADAELERLGIAYFQTAYELFARHSY